MLNRTATGVVLGSAILVLAAPAHGATCQAGVKGGVALQKLVADGDDTDSRTGFAGGGYFQADFSKSFGLRVEGLYFMKGGSAETEGFEATVKLDYIEFPVLAVAHVPLSETGRLDFFAGPTMGFNINSELETSFLGVTVTNDLDGAADFEFGVTFGAGVNFDAGSVILGVDGRYGIGLTDIADDPDDDAAKNQGFAFMASIGFPVGSQ